MSLRLALKIDVDTYRGLAEGVPRLVEFLHSHGVPAAFFVTVGPDVSGWAVTRAFKPGFMKKMQRTSALSVYGVRTVLSGTLLPARPMLPSFAKKLYTAQYRGFEISPHGYNHIRWHDQAAGWTEAEAREELKQAFDVYTKVLATRPLSFAAPGWQAGAGTWKAMESLDLLYHSDTRGISPYFPVINGERLKTLEIPTTLPTWDEMLAWDGVEPDVLGEKTRELLHPDRVNVWTIHAEFEGGAYFENFQEIIRSLQEDVNPNWIFLQEYAKELLRDKQNVPACEIRQGTVPGRAGTVTCQVVPE